jgi:hypothetical protein
LEQQKLSALQQLQAKAKAAGRAAVVSSENFDGLEDDANQFIQLVHQAADEGLWEIDLTFDNRSATYLNRIAEKVKDVLFDVFILVDAGSRKIQASWKSSNEV